jgi:hypothetical protein
VSTRRLLTSVADGTARAFVGRNNDVGGWWALGLLLDELPADSDFTIDLLSGTATPSLLTADLADLGRAWARYFRWSLWRHGVPDAAVLTAVLTLRFDASQSVRSWLPDRNDSPFLCAVRIEDVAGRAYEGRASGHCSRLTDCAAAPAYWRPMRSVPPHDDPGRVSERIRLRSQVNRPHPVR